ncbi:DUF1292 domain-containing protein [Apilactobacillus micheneri]|uniref:UPF0473 protein DY114_06850 n=1 Tax=Apilactobacillus micheneri TaxID=1899430 RepID=A0A2S2JJ46_9LACO|nr:DUF1292 domain-containing protein [Apilactobacillus micheneri]TPR24364.1 DUF1292 domain-containing protein [Apilactobacillus micheneri]TPR25383.1 DUF1292 domain-containing protein [Apilactobacillus micheneri]TPR27695.1 DUF1292 domain-containing protein [Apilactobacillus micheneri]TPR28960.1 DUF1292 domain-containing protein [Apilactobacillus micheneri]TPR29982.1 DUF1292 domain-containing protein [Apilactobacillus micheneri]
MNNEEQTQQITMVDENGNEELYDVLFTFQSEDYGKSYILLYPVGKSDDDEVNIEAYVLPDDDDPTDPQGGDLKTIDSDEEWDMVESVLNTFLAKDDDKKE